MKKSEQLTEQMRGKWAEISQLRETVVAEDREFKQDERDRIEKTLDEVRNIEIQVQKERADESLHDQIGKFDAMFAQAKTRQPQAKTGNGGRKSLGERFVESQQWQEWFAAKAVNGRIPDSVKGLSSPPVNMGSFFGQKTVLTGASATSAGAFVVPEDTGIYEPLGRYPLNLRSLISSRATMSDTVEFVRQTAQVTQAAATQESNVTDYTGATGQVSGEKPEGAMTFERVSEAVKTIAVWIPATKRALSDAAQLRGIIDAELLADLEEELENQLINGNGTGENFTGLANTAGVLTQAYDTDIAATARKAITNLLINGRQIPTAYLLHPQDWEAFDLLQDTNGRYYWGGPMAQGQRTLWGVPVVQSFFLTQGTGWVANWRKMVLWDREESNISVSDSHSDFFIRNMVAILAEMRAAMGVIRPTAFCEIDLTSGS